MKCKNCGGDNKKFTEKCNYCGSHDWWPEYEFKPEINDVETRPKNITIDPYKEAQVNAAIINSGFIGCNYSSIREKLLSAKKRGIIS